MEKRVYERLPVRVKIKYYLRNPLFWNNLYKGTIKNLSEKGMFISTKTIYFPRDSLVEIFIPFNKKGVYLPANISNIVWRNILSDNSCDGIGINISKPPREYLEFVENLRAT